MGEFDRRKSIRRTWGKARLYRNMQIGTFFLVGREQNAAIIREAEGKVKLSFTRDHSKELTKITPVEVKRPYWQYNHDKKKNELDTILLSAQ